MHPVRRLCTFVFVAVHIVQYSYAWTPGLFLTTHFAIRKNTTIGVHEKRGGLVFMLAAFDVLMFALMGYHKLIRAHEKQQFLVRVVFMRWSSAMN
jgi:hypothetical protein